MESKKQQGKRIMNDIRRILIDEWDPIGIKGYGPDDEYDSYIGGVYRLLTQHPTEYEIMEHLDSIEMVQIGSVIKDREGLREVAKKLLEIDFTLK